MKKLYILRHSKAGQTNKQIKDDHERPLTKKGVEVAEKVSAEIKSRMDVEAILVSTSRRTMETCDILLKRFRKPPVVEELSELYLADVHSILALLKRSKCEAYDEILIIGHNPGLQQFSMMLSGSGEKKLIKKLKRTFPPAGFAAIEFPAAKKWADVRWGGGKLVDVLLPNDLKKKS